MSRYLISLSATLPPLTAFPEGAENCVHVIAKHSKEGPEKLQHKHKVVHCKWNFKTMQSWAGTWSCVPESAKVRGGLSHLAVKYSGLGGNDAVPCGFWISMRQRCRMMGIYFNVDADHFSGSIVNFILMPDNGFFYSDSIEESHHECFLKSLLNWSLPRTCPEHVRVWAACSRALDSTSTK